MGRLSLQAERDRTSGRGFCGSVWLDRTSIVSSSFTPISAMRFLSKTSCNSRDVCIKSLSTRSCKTKLKCSKPLITASELSKTPPSRFLKLFSSLSVEARSRFRFLLISSISSLNSTAIESVLCDDLSTRAAMSSMESSIFPMKTFTSSRVRTELAISSWYSCRTWLTMLALCLAIMSEAVWNCSLTSFTTPATSVFKASTRDAAFSSILPTSTRNFSKSFCSAFSARTVSSTLASSSTWWCVFCSCPATFNNPVSSLQSSSVSVLCLISTPTMRTSKSA
mmetsp:Transcript_42597/g.77374  ORF Transcript_42597/g.77374 Transcript_42597/m.77374 type:complete len:280 (-) Transcript_42597:8-847(-)